MIRHRFSIVLLVGVLLLAAAAVGTAHQTKSVGDERFYLSVGFVKEPIYTDERNGLDLIARTVEDRTPVEHLQDTLFAEIIAPDGVTKQPLPIRAQHGQPGRYTSDIVLTQPGNYQVRIWGMIHDVAFDEVFDLHEVRPLSDLYFPNE